MKTNQRIVATLCVLSVSLEILCRNNLNLAIVAMVLPADGSTELVNRLENFINQCVYSANDMLGEYEAISPGPKFDWSPSTQGIILGASSYGLILTQTPAGRVAEQLGGKWILAAGLGICAVINFVTPLIAGTYWLLITSRVLLGMAQGLVIPSCYALLVAWFPRDTAVALFPILSVGGNIGSFAAYFITGFLCEQSSFLDGWPSVFFFAGTTIIIWLVFWVFLVENKKPVTRDAGAEAASPSTPKAASGGKSGERSPLLEQKSSMRTAAHGKRNSSSEYAGNGDDCGQSSELSFEMSERSKKVPWLRMLSSGPVWSIIVCKLSLSWASAVTGTKLPTYLQEILGLPVSRNGLVTSLAIGVEIVSLTGGAVMANYIIKRHWLSQTTCRKVFQVLANFGTAACVLAVPFVGCNRAATIGLFCLAQFCYGFYSAGEVAVVGEMTVNFPATLYGLTNITSFMMAILTPWLCGVILEANPFNRRHQWDIIFYATAAILVFGGVFFALFASSERQDWDRGDQSKRRRKRTRPGCGSHEAALEEATPARGDNLFPGKGGDKWRPL